MLKLGNAPILCSLKQQGVVALFTCATEYVALLESTQHLVQAIGQFSHLSGSFNKAVLCNNLASVQVSVDYHSRKWMQYLDCVFFFVNDAIWKHDVKVNWVRTVEMQADALTKCLSGPAL
ncbi:hypothetical protein O181_044888 [Austropuccinia psidii MF-1]|uniref:Uncharacterized protein n=1 Tax=Austropuccinia psidii MF-1 TaxID=1389203 RepID=A0A9Q3DP64_9BASI|nr:hypothetical protein [Austropuccinia psidii MF-1]